MIQSGIFQPIIRSINQSVGAAASTVVASVAKYAGAWAIRAGWVGDDGTVYDQRSGLGTKRQLQPKRCISLDAASTEYGDLGDIDYSGWETFYFSGWFRTTEAASQRFLFAIMHTSSDDLRISTTNTGVVVVDLDDTTLTGPDSVQTQGNYNNGSWYRIEVIFDGDALTLNIFGSAGALLESVTETGASFDFDGAVGTTRVGNRPTGGFYWDSEIYDFKYGQAAENLFAHWPMEDDSTSVAIDVTGNGNHLTWFNGPTIYEGQDVPSMLLGGESKQPKFKPPLATRIDIGNVLTSGDMTIRMSFYATDWDGSGGSDTLLSTDATSRIFLTAAGQIGMRWDETNYTWIDVSFDLYEDVTIVLTRTAGAWSLTLNGVTSATTYDDSGIDWVWTTIGARAVSGQNFDGFIWDVNINDQVAYTGQGATPWADTIGSNDGSTLGFFYNQPRQLRLASSSRANVVGWSPQKNLFAWSRDLDTAGTDGWQGGGSGIPVVTTGEELAPDGVNTAYTLRGDAGDFATGGRQWKQDVAVENGGNHTLSVWMKCSSGESTVANLMINNVTGGTGVTVTVTDEWQRFSLTSNVGALTGGGRSGIQINFSGTNTEVHVADMQLELSDSATEFQVTGPSRGNELIIPAKTATTDAFDNELTNKGQCPKNGHVDEHNCISLDRSSSQYAVVPNKQSVSLHDGEWTLSGWVRVGTNGVDRDIVSQGDGTGTGRTFLSLSAGNQWRSLYGSAILTFGSIPSVVVGQWYQFELSYDPATEDVTLTVNGVSQTQSTASGGEAATGDFNLGIAKNLTNSPFDGEMALFSLVKDSEQVFNCPLSEGPGVSGNNEEVIEVVSGTRIPVTNGCTWTTRDVGKPNNLIDGFSKAHNQYTSSAITDTGWEVGGGTVSESEDGEWGIFTESDTTEQHYIRHALPASTTFAFRFTFYRTSESITNLYIAIDGLGSINFDFDEVSATGGGFTNLGIEEVSENVFVCVGGHTTVGATKLYWRMRTNGNYVGNSEVNFWFKDMQLTYGSRTFDESLSFYPVGDNEGGIDMLVPADPNNPGFDALGNKLTNPPKIGFNGAESVWTVTDTPEAFPDGTELPGDGILDPYDFNGDPGSLTLGINTDKQEARFYLEN